MSPDLVALLGGTPPLGLTAWLVRQHFVEKKRAARRSRSRLSEPAQPRHPAIGDRPAPPAVRELQLTTVLAAPGEVLLGYRATATSTTWLQPFTASPPWAAGTLLFSLGEDADDALAILDGWCRDGVELALRLTDESDVWALSDRRTSRLLVLSAVRTP